MFRDRSADSGGLIRDAGHNIYSFSFCTHQAHNQQNLQGLDVFFLCVTVFMRLTHLQLVGYNAWH